MAAHGFAGETEGLLASVKVPSDLRRLPRNVLKSLACELRQEIIDAVSVTGGHLGAGLGVVELTVALHYVFDTPRARLLWDVSHQCYPHKVLTGRRGRIRTLRQTDGLSGFTRRVESEYDPFGAAHSSTAMSAALGMAKARDLKGETHEVIAVVGDGAMSAGLAYEGMNNIGAAGSRIIVILNDNGMSIAPAVGALENHLRRIRADGAAADNIFRALGFRYVGPVDGHDVDALVDTLEAVRDGTDEGPVLIHARTRKGKGYAPAENAACCYHGVAKFDPATGTQKKSKGGPPSYTSVFAKALIAEAEADPRIIALTAAMPSGTGVDKFAERFPDRAFDVGIAEQHCVTFAAGLAAEGLRPFAAIYSTFLQRGYDQVVHDVALQNLPVRFALDRAGLVGADGATHAGAFDIGYLGMLPNMTLMAAADEAELVHMVATAAAHDEGPIALRYPRGAGTGAALPETGTPLPIGKGRVVREGSGIAILTYGAALSDALAAADMLEEMGISATVADARFCKPLDTGLLDRLVRAHPVLLTVEHGAIGGFASHVLQAMALAGTLDSRCHVHPMVLPDRFIDHADPATQYADAKLAAQDIVKVAVDALGLPRVFAAQ